MDDLIEHWQRLQYRIHLVKGATIYDVKQRVEEMEAERIIFNNMFTKYALRNMEKNK